MAIVLGAGAQLLATTGPYRQREVTPSAQKSEAGSGLLRGSLPPGVDPQSVPVLQPADPSPQAPPDGKWLVDEEGFEYTLYRWQKHDKYYVWVDEPNLVVKLNNIMHMTAEAHDDQYFYFRWYPPRDVPLPDTSAADQAIRDSYRTEIERVDRLLLEPYEEGLPRSGQWRNGFAVADMNEDGHLDLVLSPPRKGEVFDPVIFLGDGAGGWRYWSEARYPLLPYDYGDIQVGDLNGDGHADLVLGAHLTGIFALVGNGKGKFEGWGEGLPVRKSALQRLEKMGKRRSRGAPGSPRAQTAPVPPGPPKAAPEGAAQHARGADPDAGVGAQEEPKEPNAFTSRAIALADWNADGKLDILALSEGPAAVQDITDGVAPPLGKVVYLNDGDGTWSELTGPGQHLGDALLPVDLDRDGRLDFVTDSRVVGSGAILNFGDGTSWRVESLPETRRRLLIQGVAVDDFDRDGTLDVAIGFQSHEAGELWRGVDVFYGEPGGAWRRSSVYAATEKEQHAAFRTLSAGDLDGDKYPDLVALTGEGDTVIFLNDFARASRRGDFALESSPEVAPDPKHSYCDGYRAAVLDLGRDGRAELVATFAGESGSEALLAPVVKARCPAGGWLRAWKVTPQSPEVPASGGGGHQAAADPRPEGAGGS